MKKEEFLFQEKVLKKTINDLSSLTSSDETFNYKGELYFRLANLYQNNFEIYKEVYPNKDERLTFYDWKKDYLSTYVDAIKSFDSVKNKKNKIQFENFNSHDTLFSHYTEWLNHYKENSMPFPLHTQQKQYFATIYNKLKFKQNNYSIFLNIYNLVPPLIGLFLGIILTPAWSIGMRFLAGTYGFFAGMATPAVWNVMTEKSPLKPTMR